MSSSLTPSYETITDDLPQRVALTKFENGLHVSTVHLDESLAQLDELLMLMSNIADYTRPGVEAESPATHRYELMVFPNAGSNDYFESYCERFATREEAEAGHARVVEQIVNGTFQPSKGARVQFDA